MRTKLTLILLVVTLVNEGKTNQWKYIENEKITHDLKSLLIECSRAEKLNLTKTSELNLHLLRKVYLRGCVVEKNINFSSILQNFGINDIEVFYIQYTKGELQTILLSDGFEILESLRFYYNVISNLDENVDETLKKLILDDYEITDLPENIFVKLTNLRRLDLSHNKIKLLQEGLFKQQKELTHLYLGGNEISFLPENIFANLSKLRELDLSHNLISNLPKNIFVNLTNLEELLLENNKMKILHDGLFTQQMILKQLKFGNDEASPQQADKYKNYFTLVFNHIKVSFIFDMYRSDRSFAKVYKVKISNGIVFPSNLSMLAIQKCEFEYDSSRNVSDNTMFSPTGKVVNSPPVIIFSNQKKLKDLFLSQNELTGLDDNLFNGLNELWVLDLSYNNLTRIRRFIFRELRNIIILSLDHNHIESIHSEAFVNTNKLLILNLSYNQLRFFDAKPFWHIDKFTALNLSNNYLTALPSDWEGMKTLHFLDLGHNNISSYEYMDVHTTKNKIYYKGYYHLSNKYYLQIILKDDALLFMFLNDNSLKCDCTMYSFLQLRYKGPLEELVEQLPEICESRCQYYWKCETSDVDLTKDRLLMKE